MNMIGAICDIWSVCGRGMGGIRKTDRDFPLKPSGYKVLFACVWIVIALMVFLAFS